MSVAVGVPLIFRASLTDSHPQQTPHSPSLELEEELPSLELEELPSLELELEE